MTDEQIDRIITAIRKQVEWNGWEEPYVRDCFRHELDAALPAPSEDTMTELNLTALDAAIKAGGMQGFDHIEDRMQDAIRAYLAALPAPSSDGLCERLEKRAGHIEAWGGYEDGNLHREAAAALRSRDARTTLKGAAR